MFGRLGQTIDINEGNKGLFGKERWACYVLRQMEYNLD